MYYPSFLKPYSCSQDIQGSISMWKESVSSDLVGKGERMLRKCQLFTSNMSGDDGGCVGLRQREYNLLTLGHPSQVGLLFPHENMCLSKKTRI